MSTTRLGVSGFARHPYGSFAGKTSAVAALITRHRGVRAMAGEQPVTLHTVFANKSFVALPAVGATGIGREFDQVVKTAVTGGKRPGPFGVLGCAGVPALELKRLAKVPGALPSLLRLRKTLTPIGTRIQTRQKHHTR